MLKTIRVKLLVRDLKLVNKDSTINEIGRDNNKIDGAMSITKKNKKLAKSKNLI